MRRTEECRLENTSCFSPSIEVAKQEVILKRVQIMQQINVYTKSAEVSSLLTKMGLRIEDLTQAAKEGYLAFISCTNNDAPIYPGISAWARAVRSLRESLIPRGWTKNDDRNFSLTLSPNNKISIAVATGDENTGNAVMVPRTKSHKGEQTTLRVEKNEQMALFAIAQIPHVVPIKRMVGTPNSVMWIFLVHRTANHIRCELSLPVGVDTSGRLDSWQERIILPPIDIDPELITKPSTEYAPAPEVTIQRKP